MRLPVLLTLSLILTLGFGCASDPNSEEVAETTPSGKEDSFRSELPMGDYVNAAGAPREREFESLSLSAAEDQDLPAAHYEGRYVLSEQTASGRKTSKGFFNIYRYAGQNWIRFLDSSSDDYITTYEKYSWTNTDGVIELQGPNELSNFRMKQLGVEFSCDDYSTDLFGGIDVSDALRTTPAKLQVTLTASNIADASDYTDALNLLVTREGFANVEEFIASTDDAEILIYDVSYGQVAYDWFRYFGGENEAGYIFDGGTPYLAGEVQDGSILGCRDDECEFSFGSPVSQSTTGLLAEPLANLEMTIEGSSDLAANTEAQLRESMRVLFDEDTFGMTLAELLAFSDDDSVEVYLIESDELDDSYDWFSFYAGDTEVGAMFEAGTTNLVATVGDTDIAACSPR